MDLLYEKHSGLPTSGLHCPIPHFSSFSTFLHIHFVSRLVPSIIHDKRHVSFIIRLHLTLITRSETGRKRDEAPFKSPKDVTKEMRYMLKRYNYFVPHNQTLKHTKRSEMNGTKHSDTKYSWSLLIMQHGHYNA